MQKSILALVFLLAFFLVFGCTQGLQEPEKLINSDLNNTLSGPVNDFNAVNSNEVLPDSNNQTNNSLNDNFLDNPLSPLMGANIPKNIEFVEWQFTDEWKPRTNAPICPKIIIEQTPVDVTLVTSVLYPGQERGGDFKPHGGFRFDNSENDDIIVRVPFEGHVTDGARYLEKGELQYMFDIIHPCGIMYRFDHLRELSPEFLSLAQQFSEPLEGDSRGTWITPFFVNTGDVIATAVGSPKNTGMDFGLYDLRQKNEASKTSAWLNETAPSQAPYALCWLELLPEPDATIVQKLPAGDGKNGKKSEYCD